MNHFAQAVQKATELAYSEVAMESHLEGMSADDQSYMEIVDDQEDMVALVDGLGKIAVSAESVAPDDYVMQNALRLSALEHLRVAGMDDAEAQRIFPSLEADGDGNVGRAAWERFKDFLRRLWDFIVKAVRKIYEVVDALLKKSSVAEKMAIVQLRQLRRDLQDKKSAMSVAPTIQLRPAHRYLFSTQGQLTNMVDLTKNINEFRTARNKVQKDLPVVLDKLTQGLIDCVDRLQVTNADDAVVSKSVEDNMESLLATVRPMFPHYLAQTLGAKDFRVPLIFDRAVEIHNPDLNEYDIETPEGAGQYIAKLGMSVVQDEITSVNLEALGTFPAMRINEIEEALKLAAALMDENQSTDQRRVWERLARKAKILDATISSIVTTVLKRPNLSPAARDGLRVILAAKQASAKWAAMPYVQLNGVNVRVVQSLLAMVRDQLANYDHEDTMDERMNAKRAKNQDKKN